MLFHHARISSVCLSSSLKCNSPVCKSLSSIRTVKVSGERFIFYPCCFRRTVSWSHRHRDPSRLLVRVKQADGNGSSKEEDAGAAREDPSGEETDENLWGASSSGSDGDEFQRGGETEDTSSDTEIEGDMGTRTYITPDLEPQIEEDPKTNVGGRKSFWRGLLGWKEEVTSKSDARRESRGDLELEELDLILEGADSNIQWKEFLDPTLENVLALLLTALLAYAAVLIGWQLLVVAAAITLSALKYSVIAAILLGVLVFLI